MGTCKNCGRAVGNWEFCKFCGTKLNEMDFSFQKTKSLLRQNIVLNDGVVYDDNISDLPQKVSTQHTDIQQPNSKIDLPGKREKEINAEAIDNKKLISYEDTTEPTLSETDLCAENSLTKDIFEENNEAECQELPTLHGSLEDTMTEINIQDDIIPTNDEHFLYEQHSETKATEKILALERVPNPILSDELTANEAEDVTDNGPAQLFTDETALNYDSNTEPVDNNTPELPLNLGSLFSFENSQKNDSDTKSPINSLNAEPMIYDPPREEYIESVNGFPVIEDELTDKSLGTIDDANVSDNYTSTDDADKSTENTDGFSKINFEQIDSSENIVDMFETDTVDDITDSVVEEIHVKPIENEPLVSKSEQQISSQSPRGIKQAPKSFDNTAIEDKPHISVTDIDPMFGAAPNFDIDSIKASFQSVSTIDKKKHKKGFFNRKK